MKFVLALLLITNICTASESKSTTYTLTSKDISRFICSRENVFIMENCVLALKQCVDGYMARRINLSEGAQLMNAIEFCENSLDQ